jgi:hypothetical protein
MIRPGIMMGLDAGFDRIDVPPRDDIIDQTIAAPIGEVGIVVSEFNQIVAIIRQTRDVGSHILPRCGTGFLRVAFKDYGLSRRQ